MPRLQGWAHVTMTRKISLPQQVESVAFALQRQRALASGASVKGLRGRSVEEFDCERLAAAERTLQWLERHERALRAFLARSEEERQALLARWESSEGKGDAAA